MKLKTLIIDDETDARYLLRKSLLEFFPDEIEIIGEADGRTTGAMMIETTKPDLVFLDIQMPDGNGFELLASISNRSFQVIFVTAYDAFALMAFEFSAVGYLLKPINPDLLKQSVSQVMGNLNTLKPDLKILIDHYHSGQIRKLVLPNAEGFSVVQLEEIVFVKSDRNYSEFTLENGRKILTSKHLGLYEKLLHEHGFLRIHQSFLINLHHVKSFDRSDGGSVKMSNSDVLPVARNRKSELMQRFL